MWHGRYSLELLAVLGCRREGFPQGHRTYLGLPLSMHKLPASFAPFLSMAPLLVPVVVDGGRRKVRVLRRRGLGPLVLAEEEACLVHTAQRKFLPSFGVVHHQVHEPPAETHGPVSFFLLTLMLRRLNNDEGAANGRAMVHAAGVRHAWAEFMGCA